MSELFNRLICEWFHGGGSVTRDSNGRINWQCRRCGRWSVPVSHKEEAAMIDRELASYRCQNENPADYSASVKGDLPPKVMVWRSQPMAHIGTWATTRYPVEAVAYVPEATLSAAMELPEVAEGLKREKSMREAIMAAMDDTPGWYDLAASARNASLAARTKRLAAAIKEPKT